MILSLYILIVISTSVSKVLGQDQYNIGVGIADITGPTADVGLFGYGQLDQIASGLHFRLYARSFVVDDGSNRVVIVVCDLGGMGELVKLEVSKKAKSAFGGRYNEENILLTATHTHSAPGGYYQYVLYNLASGTGFVKENFNTIVSGIIQSIKMADEMASRTQGSIMFIEGKLDGAGVSRSPTSYLKNPAEERSKYPDGNTDKTFHLLKFQSNDGKPIGVLSFFAVHCTSMNHSNKLLSGDNKGYAAMLFEAKMNPGALPGKGPFVAAFATANEGDVSPNLQGAKCQDTGAPCDPIHSTCKGISSLCVAKGPGKDMFESAKIIGKKQYQRAQQLFDSAKTKVSGPINFVHQTADFSKYEVIDFKTKERTKTCPGAMGVSFAAGTTDGVGAFFFKQGSKTPSSPFFEVVKPAIKKGSGGLVACQDPKPILLPTGELHAPSEWQPIILPSQIFQLGQYMIAALPGEFTTMSGRRVRETIRANGPDNLKAVMLAGLSNAYSSYITTPEEYMAQRYEAASTVYGINTLTAHLMQFEKLAKHLKDKTKPKLGPPMKDMKSRQVTIVAPVILDTPGDGKKFGDVLQDAKPKYSKGSQVVVKFQSANPRNLKLSTYLTVNKQEGDDWKVAATDGNWETRFHHMKTNPVIGQSEATIVWDIPKEAKSGSYKICHFGIAKTVAKSNMPFEGCSSVFTI